MQLPELKLSDWSETRNSLQNVARLLGSIRGSLTPNQLHWYNHSLIVRNAGLSSGLTGDIDSNPFELTLDVRNQSLKVEVLDFIFELPIAGTNTSELYSEIKRLLNGKTAEYELEESFSEEVLVLDPDYCRKFINAALIINQVMMKLRSLISGRSGLVRFWPHHFDLALLWFSGNTVDGYDENNPDWYYEQMNFGFSTGDELIPEAYFYATLYPNNHSFSGIDLPEKSIMHKEGWTGAVLKYDDIREDINAPVLALNFFRDVHKQVSGLIG